MPFDDFRAQLPSDALPFLDDLSACSPSDAASHFPPDVWFPEESTEITIYSDKSDHRAPRAHCDRLATQHMPPPPAGFPPPANAVGRDRWQGCCEGKTIIRVRPCPSMNAAGRRCPDRPAASYQTRRGQPGKLPMAPGHEMSNGFHPCSISSKNSERRT